MWSLHVLIKYVALQSAGWIVVLVLLWLAAQFFEWPKAVVWIGFAIWAMKDLALYPFVWRAYDERGTPRTAHPAEGAEGVAMRALEPIGPVRIGGERWHARASTGERNDSGRIDAGERVRVVGRDGMTLIVTRATPRRRHAGRDSEG